MKQFNFFKIFLVILTFGASIVANAQTDTLHPLSFGYIGSDSANYYKDYVGIRFEITYPASTARDVSFVEVNNTASDGWTDMTVVTTPLINDTVIMGSSGDTLGITAFPAHSMDGKIAVIWRGTNEFGQKAIAAQNAGAIACIIINNVPGQGPLGMLASAAGATVHIPTFMIGNEDGNAISAAYAGGTGVVTLTISPWGLNYTNDLGFVPNGYALWHDYAIPANQIMSPGEHPAYDGLDGAFIANYGTSTASGVVLSSTVKFTPTGGSSSTEIASGSQTLSSFPAIDSIYAVYEPNEYNVSSGITGTGTVTVNYNISTPDVLDQYLPDNSVSYSFYITDSLYSKSRYDFTNNHPIASIYEAPSTNTTDFYLWGPMYYVAKGGTTMDRVQWSMASNTDTGGPISSISQMNVCIFKWTDGWAQNIPGNVPDSIMENGELDLVALGIKEFGTTDSSGGFFTVSIGDSLGITTDPITLDSNSWYFVAPEMPVSTTIGTWFIGCDGQDNFYPRTYGRANFQDYLEYSSTLWGGGELSGTDLLTDAANATDELPVIIFGGSENIDSVVFSQERQGLMPSVALIANNHPALTNGVKTLNPAFTQFDLFPNPATDYINASLGFIVPAKQVTYTIINTSAQVVSSVTHNNVLNETYTYSTDKLSSGNYFIIVTADGKAMFKKFTVIR
jgi:PA domain/Secretion system C-terminal sorting domain